MPELSLSLNAIKVLRSRYLLKDETGKIIETPEELFHRVAIAVANAEHKFKTKEKEIRELEKKFYYLMSNQIFLPNSPTLMNAGTKLNQLSACFILPVPDDLRGIFNAVKNTALIQQSGGGCGFSFSALRPQGDYVKSTTGIASGPVSFINVFDNTTNVIKQGSKRRGANMAVLSVLHPDVENFITVKQTSGIWENFNVSVAVTDEFMHTVEQNKNYELVNPRTGKTAKKINARNLFLLIAKSAWKSAEPGLLFIDLMNRKNPTPKYPINSTNPCGEVDMPDYESCNLGSINLAKFAELDWNKLDWREKIDWVHLKETIGLAIRFLDNIVEINHYPIEEIRVMTLKHRRIGLGVMGFAKMLYKIGVRYGSKESFEIAQEIMKFIREEARNQSIALGKVRGSFPGFKDSTWHKKYKYASLRNATVTSIAPTGTISMIADTSSGIEPEFSLAYLKKVPAGEFFYFNNIFEKVLKQRKLYSKELIQKITRAGSIQKIKELPEDIQNVFVTAYDISPEQHVIMQASFQKYVDLGVSKTINLPEYARVKDVEKAYMLAWKLGCKGITVYRNKSRKEQVLYSGDSE